MAERLEDVIGLYANEAIDTLESIGIKVVCISTAFKKHPMTQQRVIRQRKKQGFTELLLSEDPITRKGGGNNGIQNY